MRKDERSTSEPKGVYRVRNWSHCNAGLIARGNITMWINEDDLIAPASCTTRERGRPCLYADAVIQMLLGLKQVFRLPLRALQGFAQSQRDLAFSGLPVPNYTTLSRRAQKLDVVLAIPASREPLHLVVDSTGLKVFGEGEWKVPKHGYAKRRTWRKVHLALDIRTGQIGAALMTHQDVDDASALPDLLDQIPADVPIDVVGGDGAYDSRQSHAVIAARDAQTAIPPREGAVPWPQNIPGAGWRNEAIKAIATWGRAQWKKQSGYHRRSLVENLMYRLKTLTGNRLWARRIGSQATEVAIRVGALNHMTALARPKSVRIA